MPGLYSGFAPGGAVEGLKRLWGAVTGSEPPLTLGEATGTPVPQAQVSQEPKIGADPRPAPVRALQNAMSDYGLNSEDFTNPNTQPPLRVLGAVRDINTRIMDSPVGQVGQAITMFKTPAERMAATKDFLEMADDLHKKGAPNLSVAAKEFAGKYPRIAAHTQPYLSAPEETHGITASAFASDPPRDISGNIIGKGSIGITPTGLAETTSTPPNPRFLRGGPDPMDRARDLMFHEGTHTAQALGNKNFNELYGAAHTAVGYQDNPFEIQARYSGARNAYPGVINRGETALTQLRDISGESLQEHMLRLKDAMKEQGLSLDVGYNSNKDVPHNVRLRKWGTENVPENLVDMKTMSPDVQEDLQRLANNKRAPGTLQQSDARAAIRNLLKLRELTPMKPVPSHEPVPTEMDDMIARWQARQK